MKTDLFKEKSLVNPYTLYENPARSKVSLREKRKPHLHCIASLSQETGKCCQEWLNPDQLEWKRLLPVQFAWFHFFLWCQAKQTPAPFTTQIAAALSQWHTERHTQLHTKCMPTGDLLYPASTTVLSSCGFSNQSGCDGFSEMAAVTELFLSLAKKSI